MDYPAIAKKIVKHIQANDSDVSAYTDLVSLLAQWAESDPGAVVKGAMWLRKQCERMNHKDKGHADRYYSAWRSALLLLAPYDFDSFLLYDELDRPKEARFYQPRRQYLKPMVQGYQDVTDGLIRLLTISQPKRTGKSTVELNWVNWMSGKNPNRSTLMEGTGDALVDSFYKGCLEYLETPTEYLFYDVFPEAKLVQTNADTKIINLKNKSRFPTIMCRSIDARQVGLSEATNALVLDDCVEGREEAQNRIRLDQKWEIISGDILGRALEGVPIVATGTRYSVYDPIGRLQDEAVKQGWKWRCIEIPALDPQTDISNYEFYDPKLGRKLFTTAYFREQRDMLTAEQFESEFQQQPFEAKGLIFPVNELNYFFELPRDIQPDAIVAVCDTSEGKGDSTAMPVAYVYGDDVYIVDVVFDNAPPATTEPEVAKCLMENKVANCTFESNLAGEYYARDVETMISEAGGKVGIRTKRTITNKHTRIVTSQPMVLNHFYFWHNSKYSRSSQYAMFMKEVTTYTHTGKARHDDAPDSLSLLATELQNDVMAKVEIVRRFW